MKNYYNILGIAEDATSKTINEAYKKLAQKFHPDRNPDDDFFATWFKEINEAKQVLGDEEERAEYDYKLNNYAEAYELLKHQQAEDNFERSARRKRFLRTKSARKKWWMIGAFMVIAAGAFIMLQDSDSKAFADTDTGSSFVRTELSNQPVYNQQTSDVNRPEPVAAAQESAAPVSTAGKFLPATTEEKSKPKPSKLTGKRALNKREVTFILHRLKAEKAINGVQVLQTSTTNIKTDFAIARILKEHGYIITGREIIKGNQHGINILINGNLAKVIIGVI
jgi:curved DNA-binding protein CbpA